MGEKEKRKKELVHVQTDCQLSQGLDAIGKAVFSQNEEKCFANQSSKRKVDRAEKQSLECTLTCNSNLLNVPLVNPWLGTSQGQAVIFSVEKWGWYQWAGTGRHHLFQNDSQNVIRSNLPIWVSTLNLEHRLNEHLVFLSWKRSYRLYSILLLNGEEGIKADRQSLCWIYSLTSSLKINPETYFVSMILRCRFANCENSFKLSYWILLVQMQESSRRLVLILDTTECCFYNQFHLFILIFYFRMD